MMSQKPEKPSKAKKDSLLARASSAIDLPGYVVAGLPYLQLIGQGELRMENHRGILAYGSEEIHISGGAYLVKVTGESLHLRTMTGLELLITGQITAISLE